MKATIAGFCGDRGDDDEEIGAIDVFAKAKKGGSRLANYDITILNSWYEYVVAGTSRRKALTKDDSEEQTDTKKPSESPRLVIIIEDFESFPSDVISDFIVILHKYRSLVPYVLLFNLPTSLMALHQSLRKDAISCLRIDKFRVEATSNALNLILDRLFLHGLSGLGTKDDYRPEQVFEFKVGEDSFNYLNEQFTGWDFSVNNWQRAWNVRILSCSP